VPIMPDVATQSPLDAHANARIRALEVASLGHVEQFGMVSRCAGCCNRLDARPESRASIGEHRVEDISAHVVRARHVNNTPSGARISSPGD